MKRVLVVTTLGLLALVLAANPQNAPKVASVTGVFTGLCSNVNFDPLNPFPFPIVPDTVGHCQPANPAANQIGVPIPSNGDFGNLFAIRDSFSTGNLTITLQINGVATALGCTMIAGQTSCSDAVDRVSTITGDEFVVVGVPTATNPLVRVSFEKVN